MYPILQPYQNQLQNLQNQYLTPPVTTPTVQYVNSRQSADNYTMQPNSSVILMDSTMDRFYLKTADASGSCVVKAYDFTEVSDEVKPDYVTRAEFEELKKLIGESKNEQSDER